MSEESDIVINEVYGKVLRFLHDRNNMVSSGHCVYVDENLLFRKIYEYVYHTTHAFRS